MVENDQIDSIASIISKYLACVQADISSLSI